MVIHKKRGWIRILEATIAILIVGSVLIILYSGKEEKKTNSDEAITSLQREILYEISSRSDLRYSVIASNESDSNYLFVKDYVAKRIPPSLEFSIRICNLTKPPTPCNMNSSDFIRTVDKNVFVDDVIISSQFGAYNETTPGKNIYSPKKIRLFLWRKG